MAKRKKTPGGVQAPTAIDYAEHMRLLAQLYNTNCSRLPLPSQAPDQDKGGRKHDR